MLKGILIGIVLSSTVFGYILEKNFINRDVLLYDIIYLEGRFYKLCKV
jgi:hypothetical protein